MGKITGIRKARENRVRRQAEVRRDGFQPCSQDMTICGNCQDNRSKNKCPRLNEWLAKKKS